MTTTNDLQAGLQAKAVGQAAAARTGDDWLDRAKAEARSLAVAGQEFTAEDITNLIGFPHESPGAVGTLFSHLARSKEIEWTGKIRQCTREEAHASDLRVWQAFTGKAARERRVLEIVREAMEAADDTRLSSTLTKAERHPLTFAKAIRKAWDE